MLQIQTKKRTKKIITINIIVLIMFSFKGLFAQSDSTAENRQSPIQEIRKTPFTLATNNLKDDYTETKNDIVLFANSPFHLNKRHLIALSVSLAATGLIMSQDQNIQQLVHESDTALEKKALIPFQYMGKSNVAVGMGLSLYTIGLFSSKDYFRETMREMLSATMLAGLLNGTLKITLGRSRPFLDKGPYDYTFFSFKDEKWSLPSAHTTTAFAIASVISKRYPHWITSVGVYTVATLTGVQRIVSDNHWASDVFLGALLGSSVGHLIGKTPSGNDSQNLSIQTGLNSLQINIIF